MINTLTSVKKISSLLFHRQLIIKQQLDEVNLEKAIAQEGFLDFVIENDIVDSRAFMIESTTLLHLKYIDINIL